MGRRYGSQVRRDMKWRVELYPLKGPSSYHPALPVYNKRHLCNHPTGASRFHCEPRVSPCSLTFAAMPSDVRKGLRLSACWETERLRLERRIGGAASSNQKSAVRKGIAFRTSGGQAA